jgi:hypothetical protein
MRRIYGILFLLVDLAFPHVAGAQPAVQFSAKPDSLVQDPTAAKSPTALVGVKVKNFGRAKVELVGFTTNIGQLGKAKLLSRATWVATYTPPRLRFPTVALIRVDLKINGKLVRRWKTVQISIRLKLPIVTKGAVEVSISVGNREFGPITPKKYQKEIFIPVTIAPGAGNYTISRITEQGVTSAETKRFSLPAFPRIRVVGPSSPAAGSTIRLDVFHVGAKGKRYTYNVPLNVDCSVGTVVKVVGRRSVQTFWIKLSGKTGRSRIRVALKQDSKIAVVHGFKVELANTLKLAVTVSPKSLAMSMAKSVKVLVRVTDLYGNAADVPSMKLTGNGKPLSVARLESGLWRGWLYSPSKRQPRDRIVLRATAPRALAGTTEVKLIGEVAVKLSIRVTSKEIMADGMRGVNVEIKAVDRLGMPPRDKTLTVESSQGRLAYLHHVRPGLFRGRLIPRRNTKGGQFVVTASTYRAHAVSARVRLLPIPQNLQLSTVLGALSDGQRAVGIQAGLRFEHSVYQGVPVVHIGLQAMVGPHFGVGNVVEADEFVGFSAGLTGLVRMRLLNAGIFALDVVMDIGVIGIYASYKQYNPPVVDENGRGRVAFTTSIAVEAGIRTVRQNETFLQLRLRYLTAGLQDASTDNHMSIFVGVGYRFEL